MRWLALVAILGGCDKLFGLTPLPGVDVAPPLPPVTQPIAAGSHHTCNIRADQTLWCWGSNIWGQLGVSSPELQVEQPRQVGSATWEHVSSRWLHTCGIQQDGSLWCWGLNTQGQLGNDANPAELAPVAIPGTWKRVSTGIEHVCAIRDDDGVYCWGTNAFGQLGDGTLTQRSTPARIGTDAWLEVTASYFHTCGIKSDHSLWCWGMGNVGQLGNGAMESEPVRMPTQVGSSDRWVRVVAGHLFTCGLTETGRLRCWGYNNRGQLGLGTMNSATPVAVVVNGADHTDWVDIAAGMDFACARRRDGSTWCWGSSWRGQLGVDGEYTVAPVQLATPIAFTAIAVGMAHTCGVGSDGLAYCVGLASHGQLGTGATNKRVPAQLAGTWSGVTAGHRTTCAINGSSLVGSCGGDAEHHQLGNGTMRARRVLAEINTTPWNTLSAGANHTCGLSAGSSFCWGSNGYGQVGDNSTQTVVTMPTTNGSLNSISTSDHTCGITTAGVLYCWGRNDSGQVGVGSTAHVRNPVGPSGGGVWASVAVGDEHTCATTVTGALSCWGRGGEGQLGNGGMTGSTTPVSIAPDNTFTIVEAGHHHTCALNTSTKRLSCWGLNDHGEVGNSTFGVKASPTQINGMWNSVSVGGHHVCAIDTNGRLFCWGSNVEGQLGATSMPVSTSPVQVGTNSDWTNVSAGHAHTCGMRGSMVFCWGSNEHGQLVDGTGWRTEVMQVP